MPLRGGTTGSSPFKTACNKIRRTADRVYGKDAPKAQACKRAVDGFETLVARDDYDASAYDPYQALANRLKANWPEVWEGDEHNSGKKALEAWHVS
jgi:hypothetical protein